MPRYLLFPVALTLAALAVAATAEADAVPCPADGISVDAATPDLQDRLCEIAEDAVSSLASCHLQQQRAIHVEVVEEVAHPIATCLAAFDCDHDRVRIVVRESYADLVEPGDPYALFPPDVLVRTLMFHEITHALIEQNAAGREVPAVDHEYIAAAMELEHMDPAWRQTLLDHARLDAPAEGRINIWIYRLEPRRFAANAWLHFRLPENGCGLVARLVAGETSFQTTEDR